MVNEGAERFLLWPDGRLIVDISGEGQLQEMFAYFAANPLSKHENIVADVGSSDGFLGSHSYNLLQLGWRAVTVDPDIQSMNFARNQIYRSFRVAPEVVQINAAVVDGEGRAVDLCVAGDRRTSKSVASERRTHLRCQEKATLPGLSMTSPLARMDQRLKDLQA